MTESHPRESRSDRPRPRKRTAARLLALAAALLTATLPIHHRLTADEPEPRVAVIVDTSGSMASAGMDPQRRSLLVARLLSDLVPGELGVVRLLDLEKDSHLLSAQDTGKTIPCPEDPTRSCNVVLLDPETLEAARKERYGLLQRPRRGDDRFKEELALHLEQSSDNSPFSLAFAAAQGFFDEGSGKGRRTILWLSDGATDMPDLLHRVVRGLVADGVRVEGLVFGRGRTDLVESTGAELYVVDDARQLMRAFADAFRRIVGAPYRIDHRIDDQPHFQMQPNVDEAWVVVYGDEALQDVRVEAPSGESRDATYAADRWPGAGAYRVAHLVDPEPGTWTVHTGGGGPGTSYAVVQRSELAPVLVGPEETVVGVATPLVAVIAAGDGQPVMDAGLLADTRLTARVAGRDGRAVELRDDGVPPDTTAGDGRFTGTATFSEVGEVPVELQLANPVVDRTAEGTVRVTGRFAYAGGAVLVELGSLKAGDEACAPLRFEADHEGELPFELSGTRSLPDDHRLEVRTPGGVLVPGGGAVTVAPGDRLRVCLVTGPGAPYSRGGGEIWLDLSPAALPAAVPVALDWQAQALGFWERWGRLLLLLLAILLLAAVVLGYVLPERFRPTLAVSFVQDLEDLGEYSPQPVRSWRGVGIGFYRDARAYLHGDYRLTGKRPGAVAALHAVKGGTRVVPGPGATLHRRTLDGDWETVPEEGVRNHGADVYRVGDRGPYFRLTNRVGGGS